MLNRPFKTNTLFVTASAGIGVEAPNQALTVVGNVSATGIFYGDGSGLTNLPGGGGDSTIFSKLSSQAYTLVDATSSIIPIRGDNTATGNYSVVAGGGSKTVTVGTNISNDILAYWKLDDDGSGAVSLVDSTGNSNTLTNIGNVALGSGKIAGDAVFSTEGQSLVAATGFSNPNFSISFWYNPSSLDVNGAGLFSTDNLIGPSTQIQITPDGFLSFVTSNVGLFYQSNVSFPNNEWSYITITSGSNTLSIYVNGVFQESTTGYYPLEVSNFCIGNFNGYSGYQTFGQIDEVGIWSRALSPSEITALYNSGSGNSYPFTTLVNGIEAYWKLDNDGTGAVSLVDSTSNSNTLTNNNGVALGTGIIAGDAIFDWNQSQSLSDETISITGDFTISMWVKFNSMNAGNGYPSIFANGTNAGARLNASGTPSGNCSYYDNSLGYAIDGSYNWTIGSWDHYVLVQSGGVITTYLNGNVNSVSNTGNNYDWTGFYIGEQGASNTPDAGIDEVGIWNRSLSPSEITALYNSGTGNSYPFGGTSNIILPANVASGNYSFIAGGYSNDTNSKENTFILGSNITALSANYTYVNNLSSQGSIHGTFYGDGSGLTNLPGSTSTATISSYIFTGDGVTTLFDLNTTTEATNAAGYLVTLNGATQIPYTDYSLVYSTGTNKLSTSFVPRTGSTLSIISLIGGSTTNSGTVNKAVTSIGNGADTTFDFHHNLNTVDVITQVYNNVNGSVVIPTITNINIAAVRVEFSAPPSQDQYRVVVVG